MAKHKDKRRYFAGIGCHCGKGVGCDCSGKPLGCMCGGKPGKPCRCGERPQIRGIESGRFVEPFGQLSPDFPWLIGIGVLGLVGFMFYKGNKESK